MKVKIYAGLLKRIIYGKNLQKMRFSLIKDSSGKYYRRHVDDSDKQTLKQIKKYCRRRFLRFVMVDDRMERSNSYRKKFFDSYHGIFGSGLYLCAYCGRPMRKNKVRVDHIIPVYLAGNSGKYRRILALKGIKTVNDTKNLTASCAKCNGRKGSLGGLWVVRGYFGKSALRVLLKEALYLIAGSFLLYALYTFLCKTVAQLCIEFVIDFVKRNC